ncbi:MAG TPA: RNA methyltransferase [Flavobacteriaceae bacterium]|nr:RNA methyltransferase [Flavobacteriaceae bacterium]
MLSKNQIKLINQLNQKKQRKKHQLFFAEGIKTVKELLNSPYELEVLFTTADVLFTEGSKTQLISEKELKKISNLKTPQTVLGVFKIPDTPLNLEAKISIVLDGVRDPGNLGTIIRLCDWFGIKQLICSSDTVDCYNPKTVQAAMGSLARVQVNYIDIEQFLSETDLPVFGTFMDGKNIYRQNLPEQALIVMGNEANGIRPAIENLITQRVAIPQFGEIKETESLNVGTATAIVISEFMRG